jgi:hypothetical protein
VLEIIQVKQSRRKVFELLVVMNNVRQGLR